jgi:hypothetical protein
MREDEVTPGERRSRLHHRAMAFVGIHPLPQRGSDVRAPEDPGVFALTGIREEPAAFAGGLNVSREHDMVAPVL